MNIEIARVADLDRVETLVSWLKRPHLDRVTITMPGLDTTERERAARTIRHLFNDCGCAWAALAFVVAVPAAVLARPSGGAAYAVAALSCLAAAVAGKLLGLAWSRQRLLARLRALRSAS
ncbi:hypothetical protein D7147_16075 [Micromonospora musae]|uniref:Uncharacterized protein n=1 Tax=Micromonospora musae TaxID=1894970 RepID=A0A3A9YBR0_9ACTN|nr:hypothetical protein [Micromonospora musae]RKN18921.1 hypothetical protein D7147_16075 [Micromonospora musae]RKN34732.1 hypothetical protein D7044_07955 [Micromonospora musae]